MALHSVNMKFKHHRVLSFSLSRDLKSPILPREIPKAQGLLSFFNDKGQKTMIPSRMIKPFKYHEATVVGCQAQNFAR
jgi:hypothetical protein